MTTTTLKFTRQQRLNNECTHEEYYNQFVNNTIKSRVLNAFTKEQLIKAYSENESFNTLPLNRWDAIAKNLFDVSSKMKECGDFLTLAGGVCIAKNAARQLVIEL